MMSLGTWGCCFQDLSGFLTFGNKTPGTARKSVSYLENWEGVAARASTGSIPRQVTLWKCRGISKLLFQSYSKLLFLN